MSFGKNPQVRAAVGSFRQVSQQFTKNTYGPKKGGGLPYFVDMFQPPVNELCLVRLVPGEYLQDEVITVPSQTEPGKVEHNIQQIVMPFIKFVDHFDGARQGGAICSAGALMNIREKRQPCHGCDIYWATAARQPNGRFESTRMSRQNKYAFSVFDYSVHHKLEQYDQDTGKVKTNTAGVPYYNWVRCQGQGCDACRAGKESKQGHMSHWPINYTQLQVLRLGWMCGSCGECVVDMSSTQLKKDELLKLTDEKYSCGKCGNESFLTEVYECRACAPRGQTGVRATLFDVDLKVSVVPGGGNGGKVLQVAGWSAPHPIDPGFTEAKAIDLVARYAPMSLEAQAAKFGVVPGMPAAGNGFAQNQSAPQRQPQTTQGIYAPSNQQPPMQQQQYAPQGGFAPQQQFQQPQPPQQFQPQYGQQQFQQTQGGFAPPAPPPQQQLPAQPYQMPPQQQSAPYQAQPGQAPQPQYANPYGPRPAE
jgi:hypothetical protein